MSNRDPTRLDGRGPISVIAPKTSHPPISTSLPKAKINNVVLPRSSTIRINQPSNVAKVTVNTFVKDVYVQASPGPQGIIGLTVPVGETEVYSTRVDFINDNLLYKGEAVVGTLNSTSLWRIRRITIGTDGDITEEWANGNANFVNVWNNRISLNYN